MKKLNSIFIIIMLLLLTGSAVHAIPSLQLDIADGKYNTTTSTIVSTSNPFTLYAISFRIIKQKGRMLF